MALFVFALVLLASIGIALLARKGLIRNNMNEIMVASGSFGPFLLFFVSVGEIYSIGTLIGAPGALYSRGANYGVWFTCYILLAYVVGYWLNPAIWRLGQLAKAVTIADLFGWRFNSKAVEIIAAITCIIFLMPWVQNQFAGMGILFQYLDLGIEFGPAVVVSSIIAFIYIAIAGIKAPAYVSILKDFLLIGVIVIIGVACAMNYPGGYEGIFRTIAEKMPKMLTVTTEPITAGATFTISTILFQMLGFYMLPITLQGTLASASAKNLRRNSILMPLYMIMFPFLIIIAYFALLTTPGLAKADFALLAVTVKLLPSWVIGLVAGGAALTAILVMAFTGLCVGGMFAKNILGNIKPDMPERQMVWWTQAATALFLLGGIILALYYPTLMAGVIVVSYSGLTQTFVGILLAFCWRGATKWGIGAGLIVGVAALFLIDTVPYAINKGAVALVLNFIVAIGVSLATKADSVTVQRFEAYIANRTKKQFADYHASQNTQS